ncbi:hypothetical protein H2198_000968 [Neophaeococcomyces mojaviensis]|uniref:Uncharacterized protein n=1 Tax=Neophaeococcomyces mojaviensis TaxID=3383035 RepID=A0ACC3AIH7_9EURO|nr:hypothetical protein H2198_000968 [Knufia sp. JES_112]
MSSIQVHTGFWINWSSGAIQGATRIIFRNLASPGAAAWYLLQQAWHWRGRARNSLLRTVPWVLLALTYFGVFGVLAVFSSQIAKASSTERLIQGDTEHCGYYQVVNPNSTTSSYSLYQKTTTDGLTATAYARACYGVANPPPQCQILPVSSLKYERLSNWTCPFSPEMCDTKSAFHVRSQLVDSHHDLGINAPADGRVQYRRETTCAPIVTESFGAFLNASDPGAAGWEDGVMVGYSYGPLKTISNYTYTYNKYLRSSNLGYSVRGQTFYEEFKSNLWDPIPALRTETGDLSMLFIAPNSMSFVEPCDDPIFAAHKEQEMSNTFNGGKYFNYFLDRIVSPLACVDRHQSCNPISHNCTPLVGYQRLLNEPLDLNAKQLASAERVVLNLVFVAIAETVSGRNQNALRAQENASDTTQLPLPTNQWETEVSSWFEDGMSRLQHLVQEYATGPSVLDQGSWLMHPWDPTSATAWNAADAVRAPFRKAQCYNQMIKDTAGTLSFSVLALAMIVAVGGFIIVMSLILEPLVKFLRRFFRYGEHKSMAWVLDETLQLQRMLFQSLELGSWQGSTKAVPTTAQNEKFEFSGEISSMAVVGYNNQGFPALEVGRNEDYTSKKAASTSDRLVL